MGYLQETRSAGREVFPDLARAVALFGICVVNVAFIAYPMMGGFREGGVRSPADLAGVFSVDALFALKSYTLFSFMFGVGFAYQMQAAERRGLDFSPRYLRRIVGLLVLGLLHVALLFQGDILVMYAILGAILYLFRNTSTRGLVRWGIGIYLLQILVMIALAGLMALGMAAAPEEMAKSFEPTEALLAEQREVFGSGSFAQAVAQRFEDWSQVISFGLLTQGIGALSFFVFGLAAVRSGMIADPAHPFWRRCRHVFLPIGLSGSIAGAWIMISADRMIMDPTAVWAMAVLTLFSPFSSAGYLGLVAKWATMSNGPVKTFLARGGTASLSAYLMQGLILSLIFNNYGLGLFEGPGAAVCIAIAAGVAVFTIGFASLWRVKFARGPMEHLLRGWTYLGAR